MSVIGGDEDVRLDDDYSHFRQILNPLNEVREPSETIAARSFQHISIVPFVAICGADVPNQSTTGTPEHASCSTCLKFWYERFPQEVPRSSSMTVVASLNSGRCPTSQVKVVKQPESVIIPDRRAATLKRLSDIESELGRLTRLVAELRADVLHLTTE